MSQLSLMVLKWWVVCGWLVAYKTVIQTNSDERQTCESYKYTYVRIARNFMYVPHKEEI